MGYLDPTEYAAYGLTAETTDDWVTTASALMEAYCQRPTLLVTDYTERVRVTGGATAVWLSYLPLAVSAAAPVVSPSGTGTTGSGVTGSSVAGTGSATTGGTSTATGTGTSIVGPLLGLRVRMGAVRRGELPGLSPLGAGLLAVEAAVFGTAALGAWSTVDVSTVDLNTATGELTLPTNLLGLRYSEVEATYTAGVVTVPDALKVACAQIVRNAQSTPGLTVKASKVDSLQMQYFGGSLLDDGVRSLLRPYVARKVG